MAQMSVMLQTVLYGRVYLSQDNAQECECGGAFHRSSVDEAGTSTSARGLGRGTGRRARLRAGSFSNSRTLSGWERCAIDRGGGGGWCGRALFTGEVGALQKWISAPGCLMVADVHTATMGPSPLV